MNIFKIATNYKRILYYLAVILWMALIFCLSAQPVQQSNNLSKKVTKVVIETVEKVSPKAELNLAKANHIIRKNAHFFSYMILGILMMNGLRISRVDRAKSIIIALIFCILYAITDEIHQLYVPGRGGQVMDVIIDTVGATVGIIFYWCVVFYVKKQKWR